jgi:hypothetical protein
MQDGVESREELVAVAILQTSEFLAVFSSSEDNHRPPRGWCVHSSGCISRFPSRAVVALLRPYLPALRGEVEGYRQEKRADCRYRPVPRMAS